VIGSGPIMLVSAKEIVTVRLLRLVCCAVALVVTPEFTVTVHKVEDGRLALSKMRAKVAVDEPELETVAVNVLVPQFWTDGVERAFNTKPGRINLIVSPIFIAVLDVNLNERAVALDVVGLEKIKISLLS